MARVYASDADGPLSSGTNTNTAFDEPARVGDVAVIDIWPEDGYEHRAYVIPGVQAIRMSLDGITYTDAGQDLTVGYFGASIRLWLKVAGIADPAPQLILPEDGFSVIEILSASGASGSSSGAIGLAASLESASGNTGSQSGTYGETVPEALPVSGSTGSTSGSTGTVIQLFPSSGSSGSRSGSSGAATYVPPQLDVTGTWYPAGGQLIRTAPAADNYTGANLNTFNVKVGSGSWQGAQAVLGSYTVETKTWNNVVPANGATSVSLDIGGIIMTYSLPAGYSFSSTNRVSFTLICEENEGYYINWRLGSQYTKIVVT